MNKEPSSPHLYASYLYQLQIPVCAIHDVIPDKQNMENCSFLLHNSIHTEEDLCLQVITPKRLKQ